MLADLLITKVHWKSVSLLSMLINNSRDTKKVGRDLRVDLKVVLIAHRNILNSGVNAIIQHMPKYTVNIIRVCSISKVIDHFIVYTIHYG